MTTTSEDLNKMLDKVRGLIATADSLASQGNEEAAASYRTRAEAIMFKYRIDEASLSTDERQRQGIRPVKRTVRICPLGDEFGAYLVALAADCFRHADCMSVRTHEWVEDNERGGSYYTVLKVYGFESDVRYGEMLFTSCQITFSARLQPDVDRSLSDGENVYRLRMAGIERPRIGEMMGWGRESAQRVTNVFKREAARRGEDVKDLLGKGNSMKVWRESYAEAFNSEIYYRLLRLRNARGDDSNGALVLVKRLDEVKEMLYNDYPGMRPQKNPTPFQDPTRSCSKCQKAKSGYCRDHMYLKPSTARPQVRSYNRAAVERGEAAAQRVDLTGGSKPTGRTDYQERKAL